MIGRTISRYRITDKIGEGGMGVVYKAQDTELDRPVALKFLPKHLLKSDADRARFLQEARAAAALEHPNICTIYEIVTVDDESFIAMTYVKGEELGRRIARGPLPVDDAMTFALDIADALKEAHGRGVVHRDIKPSNVMINDKGRAILMDFGLAKLQGQTRITQEGTTLGTVAYMSPEQARGEDADHRSDIWSLGVMLYEMVAGRPPFRGELQSAVLYAITNEAPPPLTSTRSDVPLELERIVNKAMTKDASARYQHVDDLAVDLRALRRELRGESDSKSAVAVPPVEPKRKRGRWLLPVMLAAVVGLAAVTLLTIRDDADGPATTTQTPQTPSPASPGPRAGADPNSLAVLPLDNLSGNEANEYFVDGMTEELITQLAQIRSLRVISRTSIMRYKDTDKPLATIAAELGVSKVLEGSVMWAGDRVRISAQLIDGTNDAHLWANSYESDLGDVLGLQGEVARAVAREIEVELSPGEQAALERARVVDPRAHELYLKGRYTWHKRGVANIRQAIENFDEALGIDPDYAEAHAAIAEALATLSSWDFEAKSEDIFPRARRHANRALELNPTLAAAYAVLAGVSFEYDADWQQTRRHYEKAIAVNPNYANAHMWFAEFLAAQGLLGDAVREATIALDRDPLSLVAHIVAMYTNALAGNAAEMERLWKSLEALDPQYPGRLTGHAYALVYIGRVHDALPYWVEYNTATASTEEEKKNAAALQEALATGGDDAYHREFIRQGVEARRERYFSPAKIAMEYASLGETDSVIVWLETALDERDSWLRLLALDPRFDPHRTDPRFRAIVRDLNLEEAEDRFLKLRGRSQP